MMKKFLYVLLVLITLASAIVSLLGYTAGYVSPAEQEWLPFIGLGLLPVVIVNLCLLIIWCIGKSKWSLLPLSSLLLNGEFIISIFQIDVFPKKIPEEKKTIKIITYNVDNFKRENVSYLRSIADWVKQEDPDVLCMQESLGLVDSVLESFSYFPHHIVYPKQIQGERRNLIFSKHPISGDDLFLFPHSGNQTCFALVNIQGKQVRVFNNHLQTTSVNTVKPRLYKAIEEKNDSDEVKAFKEMLLGLKKNNLMRASQADTIRSLIDKENGPVIVCGDFNDPPLTYTYRTMKGNLTDGFRDCGSGFGYTFREIKQVLRIDYIFYSSDFQGVRYTSPNLDYSDHKPVVWEGYLK